MAGRPPATADAQRRVLGPAFYADGPASWWRDVRALLHPPYTAWHLSYVAFGALLARRENWSVLAATLLAFFLAVGVAAHALDELKGRPLSTRLSSRLLAAAAAGSLAGATAIGAVGVVKLGVWLAVFVVVGIVLVLGYNLELFGGRLHNDLVFALAWGGFPVVVAAYAEQRSLSWPALVVAAGAALLSATQRALSTPARAFRRQAVAVQGTVSYSDGRSEELDAASLLRPFERALRSMSWGMTALAAGLLLARAAG